MVESNVIQVEQASRYVSTSGTKRAGATSKRNEQLPATFEAGQDFATGAEHQSFKDQALRQDCASQDFDRKRQTIGQDSGSAWQDKEDDHAKGAACKAVNVLKVNSIAATITRVKHAFKDLTVQRVNSWVKNDPFFDQNPDGSWSLTRLLCEEVELLREGQT